MKIKFIVLFALVYSWSISHAQYTLTSSDVVMSEGYIQSCSYDILNGEKDIIIPSTLDGQSVIGIADKYLGTGVFEYGGITSVQLPTTIEHIGAFAFSKNKMDTLDLSGYLKLKTIAKGAFYESRQLKLLDLSGCTALELIDTDAFNWSVLAHIDLDNCTALTEIGDEAFVDNYGLNSIHLRGCAAIEKIGISAFMHNSLDSLDLNECIVLKEIGRSAFSGALPSLDLSGCAALEIIGEGAFSCNLDSLNLTGCIALKEIHKDAFIQNPITNIDLSKCTALTLIGENAFNWNTLESIDLSKCTHLIEIGKGAFAQNMLTEVNIVGCTALMSIGEGAFAKQKGDTSIMIKSFTLPTPNYTAFTGQWRDGFNNKYGAETEASDLDTWYHAIIPYVLTTSDVSMQGGYIQNCTYNYFFKDIIIPDTLADQAVLGIVDHTNLENSNGVFKGKNIVSVQLPASIEYIGSGAFEQNLHLVYADLSRCIALQEINEFAFKSSGLATLDMSGCSALRVIGDYAFSSNSLTNIDLSASTKLKVIESSAFYINKVESIKLNACKELLRVEAKSFANWGDELMPSYALPTPNSVGAVNFIEWKKRYYDDVLVNIDSAEFEANYLAEFNEALLVASRKSINFGEAIPGTPVTRTFKLYNHGSEKNILSTTVPEGFELSWSDGEIYGHSNKEIEITYNPTQTPLLNAILVISGTNNSEDITIDLFSQAAEVTVASLSLTPSNLEFGDVVVGENVSRTFSILNTHDESTTIDSILLPEGSFCTLNWTSGSIGANESKEIQITYEPTQEGKFNDKLMVRSDAEGDSIVYIAGRAIVLSSDASLTDLQIDGNTIEGFSASIYEYVEILPIDASMPDISATPSDGNAAVEITQITVLPDTAFIEVTAQDGITKQVYSIRFELEELGTDASLSELFIDGEIIDGFSGSLYEYAKVLPIGSTLPLVSAAPSDENAAVEIVQIANLPDTAFIEVVAEDGITKQNYRIIFTEESSAVNLYEIANYQVYPNPVKSNASLRVVDFKDKHYDLTLQNISGQVLKTQCGKGGIAKINMNALSGIYFLTIKTKYTQETIRVVVTK